MDYYHETLLQNPEALAYLARRGMGHPEAIARFQLAFNQPRGTAAELITFPNIAAAIAEYERSQVFVDSPWRRSVMGDPDAISEQARQGALLFFRETAAGGANCASCHSGDFFTDEKSHVLAMPQIGRGKGDDNGISSRDDFGRFRETSNAVDKYAFRTPSLLNVEPSDAQVGQLVAFLKTLTDPCVKDRACTAE